jgi:hypothetical protein
MGRSHDGPDVIGTVGAPRMSARTGDRDKATTWETRQAQYDAVCAWGIPDHALLQRVSGMRVPVFVASTDWRSRRWGAHEQ